MQCRNCGAEIADKALICYRCGTATTEAKYQPAPIGRRRSSSTMLRTIVLVIAMVDDETLRDGLQSPSVRTPTIDEKIELLHHMDGLGIDTADIGLPGAGARVACDVERLARAIADGKMRIRANCAARTMTADI